MGEPGPQCYDLHLFMCRVPEFQALVCVSMLLSAVADPFLGVCARAGCPGGQRTIKWEIRTLKNAPEDAQSPEEL